MNRNAQIASRREIGSMPTVIRGDKGACPLVPSAHLFKEMEKNLRR